MNNLTSLPQIQNLNEEESRLFYALLSASSNSSSVDLSPIEELYKVDYDEVPVSIDEFLREEKYLGKVFNHGESIYPFWRQTLHDIFHNNSDHAFEVCLTGDTVIPLLDGTRPTIKELAESSNKRRYLYSYDLDSDEYTVGVTSDIWSNGVKRVYQITLDNGESFRLTSNHRLLTRDKHWKSIDSGLSVGDSLMPFDTIVDDYGYERVKQPQSDGTYYLDLTHQMSARWKYGFSGSVPRGKAVHHKNFRKLDNSPTNLALVDKEDHIAYHSRHMKEYLAENYDIWYERLCEGLSKYIEENPTALSERSKSIWESLSEEEKSLRIKKWREHSGDWKYSDKGREVAKRNLSIWNSKVTDKDSEEYKISCERALRGNQVRWSDPLQRDAASKKMTLLNQDEEFQKKALEGRRLVGYDDQSKRFSEYNSNPKNQRKNRRNKCLSQLNRLAKIDGVNESNYRDLLEDVGCKYKPSLEFIVSEFGDFSTAMEMAREYNHKIVSIDYVGEEEVYDISVEGTHNFAIGAGIVAHNCLTGAIGVGKSTVAAIAMMYQMYRVLCLKDPQKFYGLTNNSPIVFVCLNLTLDLAYSGLYAMIVSALQMSPWFLERCDVRGKYSYTISFPKNVELLCASTVQHVIGKNVNMALMDEINFSNAPKGSQRSVLDMYRNIRRRIESRFMSGGRVRGYIFLISSKNTEQDFLDTYIQSLRGSKSIIVIDKPVWEVKPPETYIGTKFKVAVGDKTKESYIIDDLEDPQDAINKGYTIIDVPTEYRTAFEQDINDALKDIAGISAVSTSKLIPYAGRIELCFDSKRLSPFFSEEIQLGLDSIEDIKDYLDDLSILKRDLGKPRFAHIDIGLKGDRLGLAVVHSSKSTTIERYTPTGAIEKISEPVYDIDLLLTIKALPGNETPLFKVREFLLWLNSAIGYNFKKITFDGFQSADSIQLLKIAGFDTGLQSVDRTDIPYLNLRACILEQRLEGYYNSIVIEELRDLDYDRKAKKVDHPIVRADGTPGSKDTSDALCGAVNNAQEYYTKKKGNSIAKSPTVNSAITAVQRINNLRKIQTLSDSDNWIL